MEILWRRHWSAKNYFFLQNFYKGDTFPATTNKCICEHKIIGNCYITNGERLLVLGNCCIKKFVPDSGRTCDKCGNKHKNRKINRCNTCREKTFFKNAINVTEHIMITIYCVIFAL